MIRRAAAAGCALLALSATAPREAAERRSELAQTQAEARATTTAIALITKRIASNEPRIAQLQARIAGLDRDWRMQRAELAAQQAGAARLLAALQNLSHRPRLLLLAEPQSAVDTARVSLLLDTIVPELRTRTASLRAQIERTAATRRQLAAERTRLDAAQAGLEIDRRRLEEAGQRLAARARSLQELLDKLATRNEATRPQIAMRAPAQGRLVAGFGSQNELGVTLQGLRWRTTPGTAVVAPADGRVAFTGPFRTYGRIVIIEHKDHVLSLVAGLENASVATGQAVRAGQSVGRMGAAEPTLYFEVRSSGEPVDPRPWLTFGRKSSQG